MKNYRTRGQGAIEYLLIIGAAILVVAIVIIAITSVLQQGQTQGTTAATEQYNSMLPLWKANAMKINLSDTRYYYDGDYAPDSKLKFTSETNCTIKQALQGIRRSLPTVPYVYYDIFLGGNNSSYCEYFESSGNIEKDGNSNDGVINCEEKIKTNMDYNFQVSTNITAPQGTTWLAWCD